MYSKIKLEITKKEHSVLCKALSGELVRYRRDFIKLSEEFEHGDLEDQLYYKVLRNLIEKLHNPEELTFIEKNFWECRNCGRVNDDGVLSCKCGLKKGRHPQDFGAFIGDYDG